MKKRDSNASVTPLSQRSSYSSSSSNKEDSFHSSPPAHRSPSQQYNDIAIEFIDKEYQKLFGKQIEPKMAMRLYNITRKSVGEVIVLLRRARRYEKRKRREIDNIYAWVRHDLKNRHLWPQADQDEIKAIDADYERQTSKFNQVGNILEQIRRGR